MHLLFRKYFAAVACLVGCANAFAQTNTVFITGSVAEKVNAELLIYKTANEKTRKLAEYRIDPGNRDFVFALPRETGTNYDFIVRIMKQGHRRLELDKSFRFPLPVETGHNYSLKITPSKLDSVKKTGWLLKNDTASHSLAVIRGELINWDYGVAISLHKVVNGELEYVSSFEATGSQFILACPVREAGLYYLSSARWKLRTYLEKGDALELKIDGKRGSYVLVNGSEETHVLHKWQDLISPITGYGYNETFLHLDGLDLNSYISGYEKLKPAMDGFWQNNTTHNTRFNKYLRLTTEVDRELAPLYLLYSLSAKKQGNPWARPKTFKEVPAFYQQFIHPGKFSDASILNIGETRQYLDLYAKLNVAVQQQEQQASLSNEEKLKMMMNSIANDTLKAFLFKNQMEEIEVNNLGEFRSTIEPFKKYANNDIVKKKYFEIYHQFIGDTAYIGKSAYNFSLPDSTGRMISLEVFKGKVIFIDVWATWCGPCKEQIPFLKKIEEEYRDNKDIVFMGISLDRERDRQKWINMIKKENLQGVQLLDDMGKSFGRKYDINAIPRFLLVSKDGKWIEIRCPRPEAKEDLKRYLDGALENKKGLDSAKN